MRESVRIKTGKDLATAVAGRWGTLVAGDYVCPPCPKGLESLGAEKILAQNPETRPETLDRSPAPFVHAATRKIRKELWDVYGWFVAAYREAADKLRNGGRNAAFPPGSFPPHLPFVPA